MPINASICKERTWTHQLPPAEPVKMWKSEPSPVPAPVGDRPHVVGRRLDWNELPLKALVLLALFKAHLLEWGGWDH